MPEEQEKKAVSPAEIQNYLRGADYPAKKNDLIAKAREAGAPQEVIDTLQNIPGDEYQGPQDLMKQFGGMQ